MISFLEILNTFFFGELPLPLLVRYENSSGALLEKFFLETIELSLRSINVTLHS